MPINALNTALAGLRVSQQLLDVTSQNMANAQTPGYTQKSLPVTTNIAGPTVSVQTGIVTRSVNTYLQRDMWSATGNAGFYDTQTTYLTNLQQLSGKPSDASSMASLLSKISDDFTQLSANPASSIAQQQAVNDAQSFALSVNRLASYIQQQRNDIQSDISTSVQTINTALGQIAQLNQQIAQAGFTGHSSADLQDQRDVLVGQLAEQMNISTFTRADGVLVVQTPRGELLADTVAQPVTFNTTPIGVNSYYPSNVGGIVVGAGGTATDLAQGAPGGKLGALLQLRDTILPQQQAQLDELAEQTAVAFNANGVRLFTNAGGVVPTNTAGSYVGLAQELQVNAAVVANPALVQQGTGGGPALQPGDNSVIMGIINNVFAANVTFHTSSLGPGASVGASGLPASSTLERYAAQLIAGQGDLLANTQAKQTSESSYKNVLQQQLTNDSGVNLDLEMARMLTIQKSYGASAQMMKAVSGLFDDLLNVLR